MNRKLTIIAVAVVGLLVVGGGALAYTNSQNDKKDKEKMAMEKAAMMKKDEDAAMKKEDSEAMAKEDTMMKDDAMMSHGSYVSLADYTADKTKYADSQKVYFFHASWCPICQSIDKDIKADMSKLPKNVTLIKTDFDKETELRKKYGVTTQYTFVQVDNDGNQTAKWSATSLDDAIAGIKS